VYTVSPWVGGANWLFTRYRNPFMVPETRLCRGEDPGLFMMTKIISSVCPVRVFVFFSLVDLFLYRVLLEHSLVEVFGW